MSHPCILYVNICQIIIIGVVIVVAAAVTVVNNTIDVRQDEIPSAAKWENVRID